MRTPAGKECHYFYGDYYRGRDREECRLLAGANPPIQWYTSDCSNCDVPGILLANACQSLVLIPQVKRPFPFIKRRVTVQTYCSKTRRQNFDGHIGCGECHPLTSLFKGGSDDADVTA